MEKIFLDIMSSAEWIFNDPSVIKAVPMEVGVRNNVMRKHKKCHQHNMNNPEMGCLPLPEEMDEGDGDFQPE